MYLFLKKINGCKGKAIRLIGRADWSLNQTQDGGEVVVGTKAGTPMLNQPCLDLPWGRISDSRGEATCNHEGWSVASSSSLGVST